MTHTSYTREELLAAHDDLIDAHEWHDETGAQPATTANQLYTDGGEVRSPPVVVKIGGAKAVDPEGAVGDIAHLVANGREVVVVHGGSTAVDETLERMGMEPTYVETPSGVTGRFTDEETMDVFSMVMAGKLNTELTTLFRNAGVDAVGLSGVDGGLLTGRRKSAVRVLEDGKKKIKRGDHSGKITDVNATLLQSLLSDGYTPIVSVPMLGEEKDGRVTAVNADADRSAAAVAGALGAELVILTDVEGVYADPDDPSTLIESAETGEELAAIEAAAEGFMTKKVMAAKEALEGGATTVHVSDANVRNPIVSALNGAGTAISATAITTEVEQ
ncbi:acetylglutamate/acetylaminoadipate kinase [Natronocalculus amylovorans]|uniref:Putative [LysW]-aminoadipate/[LysW]-glutamate kinase n=1 Tax=Natronocalculus amylovorans TaxID=2917812 RepID=A0AAE3FVP8_9EURY|nr:acetylglutamate/acetylaminoadipate kinase [Natronocalculus amylovorans]MCL9816091.1 acetylglutamate/acetylaminoadipate kinase [Natronocalculus amylovorans]NUE01389.1 acetylglutamate/acetylaminoadipate kinase [Halorubraceae archaeon YAN]